jgi:hypothetical protein
VDCDRMAHVFTCCRVLLIALRVSPSHTALFANGLRVFFCCASLLLSGGVSSSSVSVSSHRV